MDFEEKREYNEKKGFFDILINEDIAYQNKDITSKMFAESFKGKSFSVYGLNVPEIKQVLPTNIPTVKAHELRLDNLFALADNTVAIVDYESEYKKENKVKYLNYLTGVTNRYLKEKQDCPQIRMIVIYTGDIQRHQVSDTYDIGALNMQIESAFLSELDSEEIYARLQQKVQKNQRLTDEELMEFIILPLSYKKSEEKVQHLKKVVELAAKIQDKEQQIFALSGILVFTDKIIDEQTAMRIRRVISLTQVARIFEEEKQEAILQMTKIFEKEKLDAVNETIKTLEKEKQDAVSETRKKLEKEKQDAVSEARENASRQIVMKMLKKNYPSEEIALLVTDCSIEQIEEIRLEMQEIQ